MPNWCANRLTVTGADEDLRRLMDAATGIDHERRPLPFSFEAIRPTPPKFLDGPVHADEARELFDGYLCLYDVDRAAADELQRGSPTLSLMISRLPHEEDIEKLFEWDANDWRQESWGTSSDIYWDSLNVLDDGSEGTWSLSFWTAWRPPIALVDTLAQRFPPLAFELLYSESDGGWFVGEVTWAKGARRETCEVTDKEQAVALLAKHRWEAELSAWTEGDD